MKNILDNKVLRIIGKIIYILLYVIVLLILLVVLIQRFSSNDISIAGFRIFNVATGSMVPEYQVGDILVSKEIEPEKVEIGDDIVYEGEKGDFKDRIVTHRVISKREENGKYYFTTKGIANEEADPEISQDQIYGKIIYKSVVLSLISKVINNIYAFYFLIFVPITIIICKIIVDNIISYRERKNEKNNEEEVEEDNHDELEDSNDDETDNEIDDNKTKENINEEENDIDDSSDEDTIDKNKSKITIKESAEERSTESKKKQKSIIKYINIRTIIILIILLAFNAYAWFIYITKASLELQTHVAAWDIDFDSGDGVDSTEVLIEIDKIYPGMEDYSKEISVANNGEINAELKYKITSIQILDEKYELDGFFTESDLENIIQQFPFKITINIPNNEIVAGGQTSCTVNVTWPFESGDDETDTYWGNRSYEFQKQNPDEKGLVIKFELSAVQKND